MNPRPRWDIALAEYREALTARGYYAASTAAALVKRITRYANECGHASPWHATPETVASWLDGLNVSVRAVYTYRVALRAFYRWAVEAGRMPADPTADLWGRQHELTAADAWMHHIAAYVNYLRASGASPQTVKLRRYQVINLGRTVGVADPWAVTADDLIEWFGTRGWGRPTLKAARSSVRSFYGWAHDVGLIEDDPSRVLPSVKQPPPTPRPAAEAEVTAALAKADDRTRLMVRLAAELGLRINEIAHVHARDLHHDTAGAWLYVRGKGDRVRRLPVPDDLAGAIRSRAQGGYLFPGNLDGHLSGPYVGRLIGACLPPGVTPHKLRHRFASQAYAVTRDVFAVQHLLGHASPNTTQAYVAVPEDNLRVLVESVRMEP